MYLKHLANSTITMGLPSLPDRQPLIGRHSWYRHLDRHSWKLHLGRHT